MRADFGFVITVLVSGSPIALLVGDIHLRSQGDPRGAAALVDLLRKEPDAAVIFAGDALDLAAEVASDAALASRLSLSIHPPLAHALAERASRGVTTTFVAGNHDAAIATPPVTRAIHDALGLQGDDRDRVRTSPWFVQLAEGKVHVEHGHVFDPDGAPTHPLAPDPRDDVGIAILRGFIVPVDAFELVHQNAEMPLHLLMRVIRKYGPRAPLVIARYFVTAFATLWRSGARFPLVDDRAQGTARLHAFARENELDAETLSLLLDTHATPTRAATTATFLRLYLDRVLATSAIVAGLTLTSIAALSPVPFLSSPLAMAGIPLAAVGGLVLAASVITGGNRYKGRAQAALAAGAEHTAAITGASTVVLGHIHADVEGPRYRNTASFAFPAVAGGHPYLRVESDGAVVRAFA